MADGDGTDSTTPTTPTVPASGAGDQQQPPKAEPKKDDLPPEVRKALRDANKEAETLRLKLKEFEDRDKTEAQRLTEERDALRAERDAVKTEATRARVALAKGLPPHLADRLRGATEDEMSKDADELLALTKPGRPRGDVDQGQRGSAPTPGPAQEFATFLQGQLRQ